MTTKATPTLEDSTPKREGKTKRIRGISVYLRRGRWTYMVTLEPDLLTKKPNRVQGPLFDSEEAALEAAVLAKAEAHAAGGNRNEPTTVTVEKFFKEWLESVRDSIKPTTYANYVDNIDAYIVPHIGHHRLKDVTVQVLNALYRKLRTEGRLKPDNNYRMYQHWKARKKERGGLGPTSAEIARACGTSIHAAKAAVTRYRRGRVPTPRPKGLEAKSVRNIHGLLKQSFTDAIGLGYISNNPATHARLPRMAEKAKTRARPWTLPELAAWLQVAMHDRFGGMWVLAATTALRRSELAGVERSLLDLDKGILEVCDTRVVVDGKAEDSDGKTSSGRRTVSLDPFTIAALRAYLQEIGKERKDFGDTYPNHGKIMVWPNGERLHPDTVTRRFNRLVDAAGVPHIRLHDIRHTYITLARDNGFDSKILSERVGHANEVVTQTIYTHRTSGRDRSAAEAMAKLIEEAVKRAP